MPNLLAKFFGTSKQNEDKIKIAKNVIFTKKQEITVNPNDVQRSVRSMVEVIKQTVAKNVASAQSNGQLKVEPADLQTLVSLINSSVEQAYADALNQLSKSLKD